MEPVSPFVGAKIQHADRIQKITTNGVDWMLWRTSACSCGKKINMVRVVPVLASSILDEDYKTIIPAVETGR